MIQAPLRPLSIDFTKTPRFNTRFTPPSDDIGSGTSQTAIPGGAAVLMKDSAGTSMALNLDIHPIYGTPILSGQAITAKGDVLEVHSCSCDDPIASRHNLPMTAASEPCRGGSLSPEPNDPYPSPSSLSRIRQMPGPARNRSPLVLVPTQLPFSPPTAQELEIPTATPGPSAHPKSIVPTPASVRRTSQTSSTRATYHTTQECLEESSSTRTTKSLPPSQNDVPPRLKSIPTVSILGPHLEIPIISSPLSMSVGLSGISEPSVIGPLPSLPNSSSDSAPECSPCTVMPFSRLVTGAGAQQHRTPTESNFNRPSSRGAASQDGRGPSAAEVTPPGQPVGIHCTKNDTTETPDVGVATNRALARDSFKPSENETSSTSTSDLYADRVAIRIPISTTRVEPRGEGLQYDLTAKPEPGPSLIVCIYPFPLIFIDTCHSDLGNRTSITQEGTTTQGQNQRNMDSQSGTRPCSA